jgi:hypothetical protein
MLSLDIIWKKTANTLPINPLQDPRNAGIGWAIG